MSKMIFLKCLFILCMVLFTSCQREISTSPEVDEYILNNTLIVNSVPKGAKIFLDKRNTGFVTPDTIFWIKTGNHVLTLKPENFKDSSVNITIIEGDTNSIFLDFLSNPSMLGTLHIESTPPGALVVLNDSVTNKITPADFPSLIPGNYNIKLKKTGCWDYENNFVVKGSMTNYIYPLLEDSTAVVNFRSSRTGIPLDYSTEIAIERGYIKWIGSDSLLIRFDDVKWETYHAYNSGLPLATVKDIFVDVQNKKWICTDAGLAVFNDNTWSVFNTGNSQLPTNNLECAAVDNLGRAWIGTYNKGIAVLDGGSITIYDTSNSNISSNYIKSVFIDQSGIVWIGTYYEGLNKFDGVNWTVYKNQLPTSQNVECIIMDKQSNLWVACGIFGKLTGGSATLINNSWALYSNLPSVNVLSLAVDENNAVWFANSELGFSKFDGSWIYFNSSNIRIYSNRIFDIAIDSNGDKWMATYGGGVIKYKGK